MPDSFVIEGDQTQALASVMQVQLNITYPNDPDLEESPSRSSHSGDTNPNDVLTVILFDNVGQGTNTANFDNTVFDDNAGTPVQEGSAPFFASYDPQQSLATVFAPPTGLNVKGDLDADRDRQLDGQDDRHHQ